MPTLYLLRHAKSSWVDESLPDHQRPLAPRGEQACARLRRHCVETHVEPELVLCSTATRARSTLELVLPGRVGMSFEEGLYHASGAALVARIRTLTVESAMIVGHNPGLQDTVLMLTEPSPLRARVEQKFPTGALATIELASWSAATGGLVALVVPREL